MRKGKGGHGARIAERDPARRTRTNGGGRRTGRGGEARRKVPGALPRRAEEEQGRERKREREASEEEEEERRTRRGHGTTLLNVVASVRSLASVVEPTLNRALCPVLVGISGAPTGPSAVSPII